MERIENSIIISYHEDTDERRNNLRRLLFYLLELINDKIEIVLVEQGIMGKSNWIPQSNQINHIFIQNRKIFNKGLGYNTGAKNAKGERLIFNDCDVFLKKESYLSSLEILDNVDVVNPYDVIYFLTKEESEKFINNGYDFNIIKSSDKNITSCVISGGVFMIKKEKFMDIGGFDEDCYGYAHEDDIVDVKIEKLNLNVENIKDTAIHIYHKLNKSIYNKYYIRKNENKELFKMYKEMTIDEIKEKIKKTTQWNGI